MTREQIEALSGRELDAEVLRVVFRNPNPTDANWHGCEWEGYPDDGRWVAKRFSSDWRCMGLVIEAMTHCLDASNDEWDVVLDINSERTVATVGELSDQQAQVTVQGPPLPAATTAVCRASLLALITEG